MTGVRGPAGRDPARRPERLVALIRAELPDLAEEIVSSIRRHVPEYAGPVDGPHDRLLKAVVRLHLIAFTEQVAGTAGTPGPHVDLCRRLGGAQARQGGSMDRLQAAYRIGGRTAWRRLAGLAARCKVPSSDIALLGELLFRYLDRLAALSADGFLEARSRSAVLVDERRRALLRLLLNDPPLVRSDATEWATRVGRPVPAEVTMVAAEPGAWTDPADLDGDLLTTWSVRSRTFSSRDRWTRPGGSCWRPRCPAAVWPRA